MAFDHGTPVLDAAVTLDGGHHQATRKAHEVDEDGDECGLPPGKGRDPEERCAQQRGQQHTTHEAFDRLGGREHRRDLAPAKELAADVLQHVGTLHDQNEPVDEQQVVVLIAGDIQHHQRRNARDAVDGDHQSPLH